MPVPFDAVEELKTTVQKLKGVVATALDSDQAKEADLTAQLTVVESDIQGDQTQLNMIGQVEAVLDKLEPPTPPAPTSEPAPTPEPAPVPAEPPAADTLTV